MRVPTLFEVRAVAMLAGCLCIGIGAIASAASFMGWADLAGLDAIRLRG